MSTTPGKPRQSGLPTPGKFSGIPTPGRGRSVSNASQHPSESNRDIDYAARALADAIKANDPAQHRASVQSDTSPTSLSPATSFSLQSGRLSVTGRPSSGASASAPNYSRAKPQAARPSSRQSDVFTRSSSRAGRTFDIGENVRIESLGYEGVLRFIGEIDGKAGFWAGVELGGGFAGKGKNAGSVNGKQYFTCPPNCGVFVALAKLSAPTVGPNYRPPSVASSKSGRMTPSFSSGRMTPSVIASASNGRITPSASVSMSNGRITPHNGRVTPSLSSSRIAQGVSTPGAHVRVKPPTLSTSTKDALQRRPHDIQSKITTGSRASKYIGLTAQQLSSRSASAGNSSLTGTPTRSLSSPVMTGLGSPSPTRPSSSPLNTPKAGLSGRISNADSSLLTPGAKSRPSLSTPRPRIPSAVAMPPPPLPAPVTRSASLVDPPSELGRDGPPSRGDSAPSLSDLESAGRALQDKIAGLMTAQARSNDMDTSRSPSVFSGILSTADRQAQDARVLDLEARLEVLERENQDLRGAATAPRVEDSATTVLISATKAERDAAIGRVKDLECQLTNLVSSLSERDLTIDTLQSTIQEVSVETERNSKQNEESLQELKARLEERDSLLESLKLAVESRKETEEKNDALLRAKTAEIAALEGRVQKLAIEMETERKDLEGEIDELRQAGQETIALYEERLHKADSRRYELEERIHSLEEQIKVAARPLSSTSASPRASSAAEIDNETLREQVQHLQKKISTLEDAIEDSRIAADKEELLVRERVKRFKEKDDAMKTELSESRSEIERISKSEALARGRIEEIEEALRESTLALENARAEVEALRTEIANLDSLSASKSYNESDKKAADEKAHLTSEIEELRIALEESRLAAREAWESLELYKSDTQKTPSVPVANSFQDVQSDWRTKYEEEHRVMISLQQTLDERVAELDSLRKKLNRELPVNGLSDLLRSFSSVGKGDSAVTREEITGLKHIVQELQKENVSIAQRNKLVESENKLLLSETEQLRQELKVLEDNLEQSLLRDEEALNSTHEQYDATIPGDGQSLQKALKEQKAHFEMELEQIRKRLAEAEMKNARILHDLNKEITELEALVESKIYHEDELEQEVEHLREKLARSQKKLSKNSVEPPDDRLRPSSSASTQASADQHSQHLQSDVCEICERPGHDIFSCDLLRDDSLSRRGDPRIEIRSPSAAEDPMEKFCEDCESHGHLAADCPHSMDVF